MNENQGKVVGFGAISQEDARHIERQQAESLKIELDFLSTPKDEERISTINARLEAIRRLSEGED